MPLREGMPYRDIHCPNCNHQMRVTPGGPPSDEQAKTVYGGMQGISADKPADGDDATLLPQSQHVRPGALVCGRAKYPLHLGRNLVGRESKTSNADVQIPTDDFQMSREHAVINITKISNGSLRALIRNYKEGVCTVVKGMKLESTDKLVLTSGTEIKLGQTSVFYIEEQPQK